MTNTGCNTGPLNISLYQLLFVPFVQTVYSQNEQQGFPGGLKHRTLSSPSTNVLCQPEVVQIGAVLEY